MMRALHPGFNELNHQTGPSPRWTDSGDNTTPKPTESQDLKELFTTAGTGTVQHEGVARVVD